MLFRNESLARIHTGFSNESLARDPFGRLPDGLSMSIIWSGSPLFKRGRRDQLEIEIPKIGKVKTGEVGIGLVSFGVVFFVISISGL